MLKLSSASTSSLNQHQNDSKFKNITDRHNSPNSTQNDSLKSKSKVNFIEKNKSLVSKQFKRDTDQSDVIIKCLNDFKTPSNTTPCPEVDISVISVQSSVLPETELAYSTSESNHLVQGDQYEPVNDTESNDKYFNHDDDVKIQKYDHDKSKIRSQFMQRFGQVNSKKKEIIPNLIETGQNLYQESLQAAFNVVTEPFVKMQSNLDNKISDVIKQLEILRESEDNLVPKYLEKKSANSVLKNQSNSDYDCDEFNGLNSIKSNPQIIESESRIKYLEKMQENQLQLMTQLINMIGKENKPQTELETLTKINEPKIHKPSNLYSKSSNNKKRSRTQTKSKSRNSSTNTRNYSSCESCDRSRSRGRTRSRKGSSTSQRHRSKSPDCVHRNENYIFDPVYGCLQCQLDDGKKSVVSFKSDFLQELLDTAPKSPKLMSTQNRDLSLNESLPSLFDKYLNEAKKLSKKESESDFLAKTQSVSSSNLSDILKSSTQLLNELERHDEDHVKESASMSMFSDIKDVLKAVERSKSQIELNLNELSRERSNKMFNLINSNRDEDDEKLRIKKLVDGCISAISNDVQKVVSQKLIDSSKHAKLEAERDTTTSSRNHKFKREDQAKQRYPLNNKQASNPRATSVNNTKSKNASDVQKYLGKIYGKSLLDQIKTEELEEKNRILKEEIERKKQLDAEKTQKKLQSRLPSNAKPTARTKPVDNPKKPAQFDLQRPAFITSAFQSYPENRLKSFANMHQIPVPYISNLDRPKSNENIALITITPREPSPPKQHKIELIQQNLPSLSINPAKIKKPEFVNFKHTDLKADIESEEIVKETVIKHNDHSDIGISQDGTGLHLPGYKQAEHRPIQVPALNLFDENVPGHLSTETSDFIRARNVYESRALDWLEQEILARFISHLPYEQDEYTDQETQEDTNHSDLVNAIGQEGFQLFVDVGQPVDPNLIECLIHQVLEEKITSMIFNKELFSEDLDNAQNVQKTNPPMPSPRKSVEFIEQQQKEKQIGLDIPTPSVTPRQSPPPSPPPQSKPKPVEQPVQPQPQQQQDMIQFFQYAEDEESLLEVTLEEDQDDLHQFNEVINTKSIVIPPTPHETPSPSPVPPETPSDTFVSPPKDPTPQPIKNYATTSVQCDPEVKSEPKSEKKIEPKIEIKQDHKQEPKPVPSPPKQLSSSTNETELTDSTQYTSENTSTTISSEKSEQDEDETYFSEGAWLMSKSEGEIVLHDHNAYVNLDIETAAKGMILNPRKKSMTNLNLLKQGDLTSQSDGEIKMEGLNQENMILYGGKQRPGVNRITRGLESGEVMVKEPMSILKQSNEKSEGEIENPAISAMDKQKEILNTMNNSKPSLSSYKKQKPKKNDKKIVSLNISPQKASKNNIKIQSLPNEILVRDSNDFERRMFSSTPNTSMFATPNSMANSELIDDEFLDNDEDGGEQEVSIQVDGSPDKFSNKRIKNKLHVSVDAYNEKDEDTLNNMSDLETQS